MNSGCNGAPPVAYPKWVVNKKLLHETTYGYVAGASTYKCPADKSYWKPGAKVTSYGKISSQKFPFFFKFPKSNMCHCFYFSVFDKNCSL